MNVVTIDKVYCKGCNLCVAVCKPGSLSKGSERNAKGYMMPAYEPEGCIACGNCELTCPEMAITLIKGEKKNA